jgi:hypothetical protein
MHEITLMDVRLNELVTTGLVTFSQPLVREMSRVDWEWLTRFASKGLGGRPLPAM